MRSQESGAQGKPEPAKGQLWTCGSYGPRMVTAIDNDHAYPNAVMDLDGHRWRILDMTDATTAWRCVGIKTPAGRVMVGERRRPTGGGSPTTVLAIVDSGVRVSLTGGATAVWGADVVASWPIHREDAPPAARQTTKPVGTYSNLYIAQPFTIESFQQAYDSLRVAGFVLRPDAAEYLGIAATPPAIAPSPARSARDLRRAEIDLILREDTRRFPAFATARKCAVLSAYEGAPPVAHEDMVPVGHASNILRDCHRYETMRGGMAKPSAKAAEWVALAGGSFKVALAVYERARSLP